jgi:hypothetical protein
LFAFALLWTPLVLVSGDCRAQASTILRRGILYAGLNVFFNCSFARKHFLDVLIVVQLTWNFFIFVPEGWFGKLFMYVCSGLHSWQISQATFASGAS